MYNMTMIGRWLLGNWLALMTVIAMLLASGLIGGCALGLRVSPTEIYQNERYGYSLELPRAWTIDETEEKYGQTTIFYPSHSQIEITVKVSAEQELNNAFSEARSIGVDVVVEPVEGCTLADLTGSPKVNVAEIICLFETDLTDNYTQVFKTQDTEQWNPKTGRYTRNVGWSYENCSGDPSTSVC